MAATQVTVTATFDQAPSVVQSQADLSWQLSGDLFDSTGMVIATTQPIPFQVNHLGQASVVLLAVDDVGTQPSGLYWTLSGTVGGQPFKESYAISAASAPTVDISTLTPAVSGTAAYSYASIAQAAALVTAAVATETTRAQSAEALAVPKSTVTAAGDIVVATGSGAVGRLGKGGLGQVLAAGGSDPSGLRWASIAAALNARTYVHTYRVNMGLPTTATNASGGVYNTFAAAKAAVVAARGYGAGHDAGPLFRAAIVVDPCPTAPIASGSVGLDLTTLGGSQSGFVGAVTGIVTNGTTWVISILASGAGAAPNGSGVSTGQQIVLSGFTPSGYNGTYTVTSSTPWTNTITVTNATTPGTITGIGTASLPLATGTVQLASQPTVNGGFPTSGIISVPTENGTQYVSYTGVTGSGPYTLTGAWCYLSTLAYPSTSPGSGQTPAQNPTQSRTWHIQAGNAQLCYNEPLVALPYVDVLSSTLNPADVQFATTNTSTLVTNGADCYIGPLTVTLTGDQYSRGMDTWVDVGNGGGVYGAATITNTPPRVVILENVTINDYFSASLQPVAGVNVNVDSGSVYLMLGGVGNTMTQVEWASIVDYTIAVPAWWSPAFFGFYGVTYHVLAEVNATSGEAVGLVDFGHGGGSTFVMSGGSITRAQTTGWYDVATIQAAGPSTTFVIDPALISGGAGGAGFDAAGGVPNPAYIIWKQLPPLPLPGGESHAVTSWFRPSKLHVPVTLTAAPCDMSTQTPIANQLYLIPFSVPFAANAQSVYQMVDVPSGKIWAGIWADNGSGLPGTYLAAVGVGLTAAAGLNTLAINSPGIRTLYPGLGTVWLGVVADNSAVTMLMSSFLSAAQPIYYQALTPGFSSLPQGTSLTPILLAAGQPCPIPALRVG